jgi:death-on-curing protein
MHSLVLNHPFLDGNTRVGVATAEFFLERNGSTLEASDEELEQLTLAVAEGRIPVEALAIWFRQRLRSTD